MYGYNPKIARNNWSTSVEELDENDIDYMLVAGLLETYFLW